MGVGRFFIGILFVLFFSVKVFSQSQISGTITTSSTVLEGVSVIFKNEDGKILNYSLTDKNGMYSTIIQASSCIVEVNSLGYKKQITTVTFTDGKKIIKDFVLEESVESLKPIIINYERPVNLRGDTLVFDAKAISTGSEIVVEELLRNIPGITIEKDGKIRYNDKPIEKIMVEGDDLFNQGYSLLTKNMPSKPLNKIEILKNYSNNKLLKGIEDSENIALNLTLDEDSKNIWFGNLKVGYGNKDRYLANSNLMNFTKRYKTFFTTAFNNAGYDGIGAIDDMIYNSVDMETVGLGYHAEKIMGLSLHTPNLDRDRTNFNSTKMTTLSTIFPLGTKAKLKILGFLGFDRLAAFNRTISTIDVEGTRFENNEINNATEKVSKSYINILLNYDLSATQMFQSATTFNSGKVDFSNDYIFNENKTLQKLVTRNTFFDQKITYTHRWKDRNVVLFKTRLFTDKLPQEYGINDYLLGDLFSYNNIDAVATNNKNSKQYGGIEADFLLKQKNADLINFTVGFDSNYDELTTRFSLFVDNEVVNPQGFQSNSTIRSRDLYARSGYVFKFNRFSIGGNASFHQLFNTYLGNDGESKVQQPFFVNPMINIVWQIKPDNKLSANYSYSVTNTNLLQVNDNYVLTSSNMFSKGLGYFNQWENAKANVNFTRSHYLNRYAFSIGMEYSKQNDAIINSTQLDQNSTLAEALVIKGGDKFGLRLSSHYVIRKLQSIVKFNAWSSKTVYYNEINASGLRKNTLYSQSYSIRWASSFKSAFNFSFATEWNFSKIHSDNIFNNSSKYSYLDLKYIINDHFNLNFKTEYYNFGGLDEYNNYFFTDLKASYSFNKDKYSIGLEGRNLFNTNRFTTYSVSDIGYTTNTYNLLPCYIILTFGLRF